MMSSGKHRSVPVPALSRAFRKPAGAGIFADYQLGAPQFGKLILKVIASTNTITSIAAGEMDGFYQQPTTDDARQKDMGLTVTESSEPTFVGVYLINNQNVSDKRIRQAMSYAIDKDLLIEQNLQEKALHRQPV